MAMSKFPVPTEEEAEILRRNGIDPDRVTVMNRSEDTIWLKCYRTGDEITIRQGFKPWESY